MLLFWFAGVAGTCEHKPGGRGEQRADQREVPPHQLQERQAAARDQVEHRLNLQFPYIHSFAIYIPYEATVPVDPGCWLL